MVATPTVDRSRTVPARGWSGPRRGLRRRTGRIGGSAGCRAVAVAAVGGSIGPFGGHLLGS